MMFREVALDASVLLPWYALAGVFVGVNGAIPFVMVKSFPPVVRFSGISFSYNVSYAIFGGLMPVVVSLLMKWNPLVPVYYVAVLCIVGALMTLFIRQTRDVRARARSACGRRQAPFRSRSGPIVGDVLIAAFGWRSIFWVNLPICAAGLLATYAWVDNVPGHRPVRYADETACTAGVYRRRWPSWH